MKKILQYVVLLAFFVLPVQSFAYTLTSDSSFNTGTGFNNIIHFQGISVDHNNKYLIGGIFTSYNGTPAGRIVRLNPDGTIDSSFNTGTGFDSFVIKTKEQSDQKIITGGWFTSYNGTPAGRIVRLNPDGTIDSSFNTGTGFDNFVTDIEIQADGKIIISGNFTSYNGTPAGRIVRLNPDGTIDSSFNTGTGFDSFNGFGVRDILIDGNYIYLVGSFSNYNGTLVNNLARLNLNGTIDNNFNISGSGLNSLASRIIKTKDNKFIIVGLFTSYNGIPASRIVKINTDGSVDSSFVSNTGLGFNDETYSILELPDGKIFVFGLITSYNGNSSNRIFVLNQDGTINNDITFGTGFDNLTLASSFDANNNILVAGGFTSYNGTINTRVIRFADFTPPTLTPITITSNNANPLYATTGNIVTLSWTSDDVPTSQTVTIGGQSVTPSCTGTGPVTCSATLTITAVLPITDGILPFSITTTSAGGTTGPTTTTTNGSSVTVDRTPPPITITLPTGTVTPGGIAISGTCETGLTVNISGTGFTPSPTTTTCTGGTYSVFTVASGTMTITATQTDLAGNTGTANTTVPTNSGGGGGGGGSAVVLIPTPPVTQPTQPTTPPTTGTGKTYISPVDNKEYQCTPFTKYLKLGSKNNDKTEVTLWQAFLNKYQKETLPITGFYGNLTFNAIKRFQQTYAQDVLTPWGISSPTGWTYKSTRAKGNQLLGCSEGTVTLDNGTTINLR